MESNRFFPKNSKVRRQAPNHRFDNVSQPNISGNMRVEVNEVNIYAPPTPDLLQPLVNDTLTIGDLHANAMRLIHFLWSKNIIALRDETFYELTDVYIKFVKLAQILRLELNATMRKNQALSLFYSKLVQEAPNENVSTKLKSDLMAAKLTARDLLILTHQFFISLDKSEVKTKPTIRLIGDEFSDRGACDFLTLAIFEYMHANDIPFSAILSNHAILLIECYEKGLPYISTKMDIDYTVSMASMQFLIDKNVVQRSTIDNMIEKYYLPHLKLLDAEIVDDKILIYSHAPIDLDTLSAYADRFGVKFRHDTKEALLQTIKNINDVFQTEYVKKKKVHELYQKFSPSGEYDKFTDPVGFGLWNRNYEKLSRVSHHNNYEIMWVHGHDSKITAEPHVINLDNKNGKTYEQDFLMKKSFDKVLITKSQLLENKLALNNASHGSKENTAISTVTKPLKKLPPKGW